VLAIEAPGDRWAPRAPLVEPSSRGARFRRATKSRGQPGARLAVASVARRATRYHARSNHGARQQPQWLRPRTSTVSKRPWTTPSTSNGGCRSAALRRPTEWQSLTSAARALWVDQECDLFFLRREGPPGAYARRPGVGLKCASRSRAAFRRRGVLIGRIAAKNPARGSPLDPLLAPATRRRPARWPPDARRACFRWAVCCVLDPGSSTQPAPWDGAGLERRRRRSECDMLPAAWTDDREDGARDSACGRRPALSLRRSHSSAYPSRQRTAGWADHGAGSRRARACRTDRARLASGGPPVNCAQLGRGGSSAELRPDRAWSRRALDACSPRRPSGAARRCPPIAVYRVPASAYYLRDWPDTTAAVRRPRASVRARMIEAYVVELSSGRAAPWMSAARIRVGRSQLRRDRPQLMGSRTRQGWRKGERLTVSRGIHSRLVATSRSNPRSGAYEVGRQARVVGGRTTVPS